MVESCSALLQVECIFIQILTPNNSKFKKHTQLLFMITVRMNSNSIATVLLLSYCIAIVLLLHFPFFFPMSFLHISIMFGGRSTRRLKAKCHFVFLADPAWFIVYMRMDMRCGRWQTESVGSVKQSTNASASLYCSSLSPYHSISALFISLYLYLFYTQSYSLILNRSVGKHTGSFFSILAPSAPAALLPF